MLGRFSEESLRAFAEFHNLNTGNQDFSEGVFDFKVCQKPDGKHYGIPDNSKCTAPAKEVKTRPDTGFLNTKAGKGINYDTAKTQGDNKTDAFYKTPKGALEKAEKLLKSLEKQHKVITERNEREAYQKEWRDEEIASGTKIGETEKQIKLLKQKLTGTTPPATKPTKPTAKPAAEKEAGKFEEDSNYMADAFNKAFNRAATRIRKIEREQGVEGSAEARQAMTQGINEMWDPPINRANTNAQKEYLRSLKQDSLDSIPLMLDHRNDR